VAPDGGDTGLQRPANMLPALIPPDDEVLTEQREPIWLTDPDPQCSERDTTLLSNQVAATRS